MREWRPVEGGLEKNSASGGPRRLFARKAPGNLYRGTRELVGVWRRGQLRQMGVLGVRLRGAGNFLSLGALYRAC